MERRKLIILTFLFAFVLTGAMFMKSSSAMAAGGNLSWGSRGGEVVKLQQTLNTKGYWCGSADGIFGVKTYNAVVRFQKAAGLRVDGIVGPRTKQALGLSSTTSGSTVSRSGSTAPRGSYTLTLKATGYCPCAKCNYPFYGKPSYLGYPLGRGIAAVDPKVIPMGSKLYIEGYGEAIAADQGGAIKGNRIDLCFATHQQALNWGIKTVKVTVMK